jgi:hypothetical protein
MKEIILCNTVVVVSKAVPCITVLCCDLHVGGTKYRNETCQTLCCWSVAERGTRYNVFPRRGESTYSKQEHQYLDSGVANPWLSKVGVVLRL